MNDLARQQLRTIVAEHGRAVCEDPHLCCRLLAAACPGQPREVNALTDAVEHGIPDDLLNDGDRARLAVYRAGLVRRLVVKAGMAEEVARWAVACWVSALGAISANAKVGTTGVLSDHQPTADLPEALPADEPVSPPGWYLRKGAAVSGPMCWAELQRLADRGEIEGDDLVRRDGWASWFIAESVRGLFPQPFWARDKVNRRAAYLADQPEPPVKKGSAAWKWAGWVAGALILAVIWLARFGAPILRQEQRQQNRPVPTQQTPAGSDKAR
jgi:hypothetical protein